MNNKTKVCPECSQELPRDSKHFYERPDGYFNSYCLSCQRERQRKWNRANAEKIRAASRARYAAKREETRAYNRRRYAERREALKAGKRPALIPMTLEEEQAAAEVESANEKLKRIRHQRGIVE